jgi:hypothetical protein
MATGGSQWTVPMDGEDSAVVFGGFSQYVTMKFPSMVG